MKRKCILVDKTELVLAVEGKKNWKSYNLTYDQIVRIQFGTDLVRQWFKKVPVHSIRIFTPKTEEPILYLESRHREYFEEYLEKLQAFAKRNHISFQDH